MRSGKIKKAPGVAFPLLEMSVVGLIIVGCFACAALPPLPERNLTTFSSYRNPLPTVEEQKAEEDNQIAAAAAAAMYP